MYVYICIYIYTHIYILIFSLNESFCLDIVAHLNAIFVRAAHTEDNITTLNNYPSPCLRCSKYSSLSRASKILKFGAQVILVVLVRTPNIQDSTGLSRLYSSQTTRIFLYLSLPLMFILVSQVELGALWEHGISYVTKICSTVVSLTTTSFICIIGAVSGPIAPPICRNTATISTAKLPTLTSCGKTQ